MSKRKILTSLLAAVMLLGTGAEAINASNPVSVSAKSRKHHKRRKSRKTRKARRNRKKRTRKVRRSKKRRRSKKIVGISGSKNDYYSWKNKLYYSHGVSMSQIKRIDPYVSNTKEWAYCTILKTVITNKSKTPIIAKDFIEKHFQIYLAATDRDEYFNNYNKLLPISSFNVSSSEIQAVLAKNHLDYSQIGDLNTQINPGESKTICFGIQMTHEQWNISPVWHVHYVNDNGTTLESYALWYTTTGFYEF